MQFSIYLKSKINVCYKLLTVKFFIFVHVLTGRFGGSDREPRQPALCILSPHRGHQQKTQNITVKTTVIVI